MASKAPPKQRYRYTIEWVEILSQREQVAVEHTDVTCATSDDEAYNNVRYRLERATGVPPGTYQRDALQMRVVGKIPTAPRRKRQPLAEPAKALH